MNLTKEQKESFNENGFLVIENFFSDIEIKEFQEALREIIRSYLIKASNNEKNVVPEEFFGNEFNEGIQKLESINHQYVAEVYDTIFQTPEFLRLISKRETTSYVNQLLNKSNSNPLYTYTCRCRIDPPKDNRRTYGWHQEIFYSIPNSEFLQTWAPLVSDTTKEMGTIEVCVGSHKEGIPPQSWNEEKNKAIQIIVEEEFVNKYPKRVIMEMKLGQLLIFNSKLFHRSGNNTSNKVRYSLVGMYHNVTNEHFSAPNLVFKYREKTPQEFYNETFYKNNSKLI